jgi:GNAT superfamily N-acetyltransferase
MPEISIRPAQARDAEALKDLLHRSWRTHWGPHVSAPSRERFERELPANDYVDEFVSHMQVAVRGHDIVGMYHLEGDYLHAIHVAADQIGSGVGRVMMAAAEEGGARRLEVRAFNARARQFYAARGWQEVDRADATEMGTPVVTINMARPQAKKRPPQGRPKPI